MAGLGKLSVGRLAGMFFISSLCSLRSTFFIFAVWAFPAEIVRHNHFMLCTKDICVVVRIHDHISSSHIFSG